MRPNKTFALDTSDYPHFLVQHGSVERPIGIKCCAASIATQRGNMRISLPAVRTNQWYWYGICQRGHGNTGDDMTIIGRVPKRYTVLDISENVRCMPLFELGLDKQNRACSYPAKKSAEWYWTLSVKTTPLKMTPTVLRPI